VFSELARTDELSLPEKRAKKKKALRKAQPAPKPEADAGSSEASGSKEGP